MANTTTRVAMTGQERVNLALQRRDHDRVPRHDSPWPDTMARWRTQGFTGERADFERWLGSDIRSICWSWPSPYPGKRHVLSEDEQTQVIVNQHGNTVRVWKARSGTPEHIAFGCDSEARWRNVFLPALLSHPTQIDPVICRRHYDEAAAANRWTCLSSPDPFEAIRQLMGDEVTLSAMASEPEWIREISNTYTDLYLRSFQAVLDTGAKPDGMWVYGDVAYNHGPFFSPAMYRDLIRPDHIRMRNWAAERGMKFIYHSDGDIRPLIDLFIGARFDCLQPLEAKAGMDVRELVPKYGTKLSFFGNIDMTVASTNDLEQVEHEVVSKLSAGMARRGYLFHSDHSIPPGVDWGTYQFIVRLLDEKGSYA